MNLPSSFRRSLFPLLLAAAALPALPARAEAMYAPELRGNSDEIKLNIVD